MRDLLYDDNGELREDLERDWPQARLNHVWDDIHESRLEVEIDGDDDEFEWICWLIRTGWASISFMFQMRRLSPDPDLHNLVLAAMDKEIPDWRNKSGKKD